MRTPIKTFHTLIAALLIVAAAGGCTTYVTPAPTPGPSRPVDRIEAPEPEPDLEPLQLDIGRPTRGQLLLQTNRPAYVAIFEIVPDQGVTLIYPAAVHQQNMLISGLTWVPLWWSPRRVSFDSERYIYAVAAEEPLRLSAATFEAGFFARVLGIRVYSARSPYATMRAISRQVVPNVPEEGWAEDVYVVKPSFLYETYRVARVHCPGGRVYEVPEEMVSRIWCPTRTRVIIVDASRPRGRREYPVGRPTRPDSVFGQGGTRVKFEPRRPRGPIARVVDPTGGRDADRNNRDVRGDDDGDRNGRDDGRGNPDGRDERVWPPRRDDQDDRDDRDDSSEKLEKVKRGSRIIDIIRDAKKAEQEREKQERESQRREAEEARRREAEERRAERDERKDERKDEREARKDERDQRKDERPEEPKQQGQAREEEKREKVEEKREEKQEKREDKQEARDDKGRPARIKDVIKDKQDKKDKP